MCKKYVLLDIDDTLAPWLYKGSDAIVIDSFGIELGIPKYIAEWLKKVSEKEIHVVWCTSRPSVVCSLIEKTIGFKSAETKLEFPNPKYYAWNKLYGINKFCVEHPNDIVIIADNDVKVGTRGIENLPDKLKLIWPSDKRGCLSLEDLELIDSF